MNLARVMRNLWATLLQWAFYRWGNLRAGLLGVQVGARARVSPRAQLHGVFSVGEASIGSDVHMGEGSYVGSGFVMSARIGRWCSIGYEVVIGPTEHDPDAPTTSPVLARVRGLPGSDAERATPPPVIDDEVWIGAKVVVLRGVHIGHGAVVAAGAVVVSDIPPMEIWGGVPARLIRRRHPS